MIYFKLQQDLFRPRWIIGKVHSLNNWTLVSGHKVPLHPKSVLSTDIYRISNEVDFSLSATYSVPIVSEKMKNLLNDIDNISFYPLDIKNQVSSEKYYVLIIERLVDAIDKENSDFKLFEQDDPARPDLAGQYKSIYKMIIDPEKVPSNTHIFRLENASPIIIISEKVYNKILNLSGIKKNLSPCNV